MCQSNISYKPCRHLVGCYRLWSHIYKQISHLVMQIVVRNLLQINVSYYFHLSSDIRISYTFPIISHLYLHLMFLTLRISFIWFFCWYVPSSLISVNKGSACEAFVCLFVCLFCSSYRYEVGTSLRVDENKIQCMDIVLLELLIYIIISNKGFHHKVIFPFDIFCLEWKHVPCIDDCLVVLVLSLHMHQRL